MLSVDIDISPIEAFLRLRTLKDPFIISTWENGRVVAVGAGPFAAVIADEKGRTISQNVSIEVENPFEALSLALKRHHHKGDCPFGLGAVGYFSYDLKDIVEPRLKGKAKAGGLGLPLMRAGLYDPVFVYNEKEKKGRLVSVLGDRARLSRFAEILSEPAKTASPQPGPARGIASNMTEGEYLRLIKKAKGYIEAGDIYQINLSQRLTIDWQGDPFSLFAKLFEGHQAPFASFLDCGDFQIISNSPERLVRIKNGFAETSPIKGTRPRGMDTRSDSRLIEELKDSVKERAEHVMIVDLERNDLGRICEPGTVEVSAFETIETFPHLHHMTSTVKGRLKAGVDCPAALKALFPGGSVTGAPKFRAMEIIDELEPTPREVYTGGIGWMGFNGDMDVSMAIRTAVYKDGSLYLNVGGGIVADSVPRDEFEETLLKASDFLGALGLSNGGLK